MTKSSKSLKKIAAGASIIFIGIFLSKLLSYTYRLYVARFFGPEIYGQLMIGLAVTGLIYSVSLLGLSTGVVRYISFYRAKNEIKKVNGVFISTLEVVFPLSLILSALFFIFSNDIAIKIFHDPQLTNVFKIMAISIPFSAISKVFHSLFRAIQKVEYEVYAFNISLNVFKLIAVILLGFIARNVYFVSWSWTIACFLMFLLSTYYLEKLYPTRLQKPYVSMKRELLIYSMPLIFSEFMWMMICWMDTLVIGYFKTAVEVGIYNAALPTAMLLLVIPVAFAIIFMPIITELYSKKKFHEMEQVYKTVTKWIFYIDIPIFLFLILFSKSILGIFFGQKYVAGYSSLIVITTGVIVYSVFRTSMEVLSTIKKTKHLLVNMSIATIVNFILNVYLVPKYNIIGAALASAISFSILGILAYIEVLYFTKLSPFSKKFFNSFFAAAISIFITYYVSKIFLLINLYSLLALGTLYIFLYLFILLILKGFEKEDLKILKEIGQKFSLKLNFINKILESM